MEENNKVSVIIPVYNVEDYLERCLDSVINQTYKNLEIIVVDDGSTDNSGEICDEYAKKDSRIIVIHKENGGLSSARNSGMDICTGDYIAFVDSDDYIHPITYDTCMNIMFKEEVDYVEFEYKNVSKTEVFEVIKVSDYEISNSYDVINGRIKWEKHNCLAWNKLFKSDFILPFRFQLDVLNEDSFIFNEYVLDIKNKAYIPLSFYYYFQRSGSIMNQNYTLKHIDGFRSHLMLYNTLKNHNINLYELQLKKIFNQFRIEFKKITEEHQDESLYIRIELLNVLLTVFDDLINSQILNIKQKKDLELAKTNPKKYIKNIEIDVLKNLDKVKISVILPIYNVEDYLHECMLSIINQTLKEIEVICVNDGSTDNSMNILLEYAKNDERIVILEQDNQGAGVARNTGLNKARGEYVSFLDPDDFYFDIKTLSKLYEATQKSKCYIVGGSLGVYKENRIIFDFQDEKQEHVFINDGIISYNDFQNEYYFQKFIYNRAFIEKHGLRFPTYRRFEDPVFLVSAMIKAKEFYVIKDITYIYRTSHKKINWNTETVNDLLNGICDCIELSIFNCLQKLLNKLIERLYVTFQYAYFEYLYGIELDMEILNVFLKINQKLAKALELNQLIYSLNKNQESDIHLSINDPDKFITKYEKGIVRK